MESFVQKVVVTNITNWALKKDTVLSGLKNQERNFDKLFLERNTTSGKEIMREKLLNTLLLKEEKVNQSNANIVGQQVNIKSMTGLMSIINIQEILKTTFVFVEDVIENMILKTMVIKLNRN